MRPDGLIQHLGLASVVSANRTRDLAVKFENKNVVVAEAVYLASKKFMQNFIALNGVAHAAKRKSDVLHS